VPLSESPASAGAEFALQLLRILQDQFRVLDGLFLGAAELLEGRDQPVPRIEGFESHPVRVSCGKTTLDNS